MHKLTITEQSHDQRADRFLHKLFDVPKSVVQKWFRTKRVKKNGRRIQASDRVYTGDIVELYAAAEYRDKGIHHLKDPTGEEPAIVFENADLLIMYKPPGQLSHAAQGREYGKNLVDGMIRILLRTGEYVPRKDASFTPAIVNRLDRNTGGLVIGAKHYEALKVLNEAMRKNEIEKYYTALCWGRSLPKGPYEAFLYKDHAEQTSRIENKGKYVRSDIMASRKWGQFHLHTIRLHTGRTHQIRAQLQYLGAPIAGDPKYGDPEINAILRQRGFRYQFLCADALVFRSKHPLLYSLRNETVRLDAMEEYEKMLTIARSIE